MTTLTTLQDILETEYRIPREKLQPDAVLSTIGMDSLNTLELMFKIEDAFQVTIADDVPADLLTVADVVQYIDGLVLKGRPPGNNAASA